MKMNNFFILLTIMFLLQTPFSVMGDRNIIESTCKGTPFYNLCLSTLLSNPKSQNADLANLGLIMVAATGAKASQAINMMKKISNPSESLKGCVKAYDAVITADIPVAVRALNQGNPKFAENSMADIEVVTDGCNGSFDGAGSPLNGMNKVVHDLAMVGRAMVRKLM